MHRASASFVETSAEGYILLCFTEKRKSKAAFEFVEAGLREHIL